MDKRKKSKFQRRINRIKNKMQYLRKRLAVPFICVLLCFSLISVTLFSTKQQAYATGVEELLYYTYWDLISGLFAETGYQYSVKDEYYTSPRRATGKQVWDNFCTWVEEKAQVLGLPVRIVYDELKNLPNVVNADGVSMSEELSELLAKVLPTAVEDCNFNSNNLPDIDSFASAALIIASVCGTAVSSVPEYGSFGEGYYLNIFQYSSGEIGIFTREHPVDYMDNKYFYFVGGYYYPRIVGITFADGFYSTGNISSLKDIKWIVKNGLYVDSDGIAFSDYARVKVKEKTDDKDGVYVPGVGWKTKWNVWDDVLDGQGATDKEKDEWWLRYHVNELLKDLPDSGDVDPDDEKRRKQDNEKDKLPVVLPIPFKPDKDTEKDTETETESESEKDTEPAPGPIPKPNPTEDESEDDTESQKHIQDVIINAGGSSGGNWKKLFPFCIPWDIMTLIKSMNAEKKAPHFKYEHTFKGINYTFSIDVDMSDYWKYIKIFRWGMTIFFIIGLFFLTVKFTTFVHRGS